ncbi:MAG: hypothetical protein V3S98_00175 [Dehalococcoidia bacterium]
MGRGNQVSELRVLVASYEQDLVRWEVTHFMDKWVHRTADFVLHRPSGERRREEAIGQFFALRDDLRQARDELDRTVARADADPGEAQTRVLAIERERASLAGIVEEALESTLSGVLDDQGIIGGVWALKWPPVDFAFEADWLVLVRSPRERIERLSDVLLEPDVSVLDRIALEDEVESANPLHSALVVRVGGVATYPAKVTLEASLHGTLRLASHEWLHHWLIFRPLGRRVLSGGELSSINETVADIFAEEIGDLALTRLTGEVFPRPPWEPPTLRHVEEPPDDVFDFTREMRGTRLRLEELLDEGQVEAAEAFLEERRLQFVANGFNIHKLNTAWFAYNGTYAGRAESISPIEGQLRAIRADAGSLSEFLDRVSGIDREGELKRLAGEAGWEPTPLVTSDG